MSIARQLHGAALHSSYAAMREKLPIESSRATFSPVKFPAARYRDIAPYIRPGGRLQYCGAWYNPVSDLIRWKTYGPWSHSAMAGDDDGVLTVIQVCAKTGCTESSLYEAVAAAPGRWYYSPINHAMESRFDGEGAVRAFREHLGEQYGFRGIALQTVTAIPFVAAAAFTMQMHRWPYFAKSAAFCSGGVKMACAESCDEKRFDRTRDGLVQIGGGIDPFPHRQHSLCTPLDIAESLLWEPTFTALYPNDWNGP